MTRIRALILVLALGASACFAAAQDRDPVSARGAEIARSLCAQCHAIGTTGSSPHVGAPPFRNLDERLDLDTFAIRLRNGLTSGHPDMPTFRFSRADARALVAYLLSIQQ
jgi:mono/diheme cytochrome c family protein